MVKVRSREPDFYRVFKRIDLFDLPDSFFGEIEVLDLVDFQGSRDLAMVEGW